MILAMDVGNTNVKLGVFDGDELKASWRLSTKPSRTSDEYGTVLLGLLASKNIGTDDIDAVVMSSVAPVLNYTIEHMCKYYLGCSPIVVTGSTDVGLKVAYGHPAELGADRLVSSAAAYSIYGGPVIVVDFGTATTFNLVSKDGVFLGGAIAPGIKTAAESLEAAAAKLPRVELVPPSTFVGTDTRTAMQIGIVYGCAGQVKYLVDKYRALKEMKGAKVIATGGLSELVNEAEKGIFDGIDRALALKGLKLACDRLGAKGGYNE